MPGINATGLPNTQDYVVGRGIAYFARLDANNYPQEYRDLGNCPSFKVNASTKLLEHFSSRQGIKELDAQIVSEQKLSLTLELDEINFNNLALALAGDFEAYSNTTATGGVTPASGGNLFIYGAGCWYDLYAPTTGEPTTPGGDPADNRIYDIGAITVKNAAGSTTYVLGTDYYVDSKMGRIFVIPASMGGTMTPGTAPSSPVEYKVTIAANSGADTGPSQMEALTNAVQIGALKFILQNPADANELIEFQFHKVQLIADGEISLIGDDFMKLTLKGDAQANPQASPNSPVLTVRTHIHAQGAEDTL